MPGRIATCLWFDGNGHEAATFYCSVFDDAEVLTVFHKMNTDGSKGEPLTTTFRLGTQLYETLDGGAYYQLTPATSISVTIETQEELDRIWAALLQDGGKEMRCGWLTDRFGLTWQIVPKVFFEYIQSDDRDLADRVMAAMMNMVKFDITALDAAARG